MGHSWEMQELYRNLVYDPQDASDLDSIAVSETNESEDLTQAPTEGGSFYGDDSANLEETNDDEDLPLHPPIRLASTLEVKDKKQKLKEIADAILGIDKDATIIVLAILT